MSEIYKTDFINLEVLFDSYELHLLALSSN